MHPRKIAMRSPALLDFNVRFQEAVQLVHLGRKSDDPGIASACAKSATVLLSASLERFANDSLDQACRSTKVNSWEGLPKGIRTFLVGQISRKLSEVSTSARSVRKVKETHANRLREAVSAASSAFQNPSSWDYLPEFGVFLEGAAAPQRLDALLRDFRSDGKGFFDMLQERGRNRHVLARSLTDLIETRHSVAHAQHNRLGPSPNDVAGWAVMVVHSSTSNRSIFG